MVRMRRLTLNKLTDGFQALCECPCIAATLVNGELMDESEDLSRLVKAHHEPILGR